MAFLKSVTDSQPLASFFGPLAEESRGVIPPEISLINDLTPIRTSTSLSDYNGDPFSFPMNDLVRDAYSGLACPDFAGYLSRLAIAFLENRHSLGKKLFRIFDIQHREFFGYRVGSAISKAEPGRSDDADIVNTTISVIGKKTGASFVVLWPIGFTALEAVFNLAPELYAHEVVGFVPSVGCHGRETA